MLNNFTVCLVNNDTINPRKSAPIRLNDNPKYMHCPYKESNRPCSPLLIPSSNVKINWESYKKTFESCKKDQLFEIEGEGKCAQHQHVTIKQVYLM